MHFNKTISILLLATTLVICSCHRVSSVEDYNDWLNDKAHGCIKEKSIAGATISAKFQPPSYLALKDNSPSNIREEKADFQAKKNQKTLTFLVSIGPDKSSQVDKESILNDGSSSYREYSEKVIDANFFMDQHFSLWANNMYRKPVMVLMDNTYELSEKKLFTVVFENPSSKISKDDYVLVYEDPFYQMGKVQMIFAGEDLNKSNTLE